MALSVGATPNSVGPRFARWIDDDSLVIRQSVKTSFAGPFLYLLFGSDRALLIDSGAGGLKIHPTVDRMIAEWRTRHRNRPIRLIVAHSHGHGDHHGDHHGGEDEFRDRPDTELVGLQSQQVAAFFGIRDWPIAIGRFDPGHRVLDIVPAPGHEPAHIMIYDARTRLIFSGDMLYPGRLYVPRDRFDGLRASAVRLAGFARTHPVRAPLGAPIEMTTTPGKDYPMGAASHPSEHGLALPPSAIDELEKAVTGAKSPPEIDRHPDFIVYPVAPKPV